MQAAINCNRLVSARHTSRSTGAPRSLQDGVVNREPRVIC
jgi:hypothetical protein